MKTASVTEAKNNLSALLEQVQLGQTILILDRNRPVARLVPALGEQPSDEEWAARLGQLERTGGVRRASGALAWVLDEPPPGPHGGAGVVRSLLDERRDGR